ncbi:MAG: hypothetical protein WCF84_27045 [Anaerolineae bacterium]
MNYWRRRSTHAEAWAYLDALQPDLALLQETHPQRETGRNILWQPIGGRRDWGSAIVSYGNVNLTPIPAVRLGERRDKEMLEDSHPGCVRVAEAGLSNGTAVTVISIYGLNSDPVRNGIKYATTTVHRILSDLMPILDVARAKERRVILAGDLNVSPQIPQPNTIHHEIVIKRIKAFGLVDCLGETHDGYVRTYRHRNNPNSTPYQDDWVFATENLHLISCEAKDEETAWALSDHCPVIAEFEIPAPI